MDFMHETSQDERAAFGSHWCGPDQMPHATMVKVATYHKPDGSDGHDCEVWCEAWPARFYSVRAAATVNSVGENKAGFSIGTGSGQHRWAALTAKLIADGMIGLEPGT